MRSLVPFCIALLAGACGGNKTPADAGPMIDTSCGIDCAAQARYGLLTGQCYEYSDTSSTATPPALAAEVLAKTDLEGGMPVMQVRYTVGGTRKLQDSFTLVNGELKLVRREFGLGGTSVSYKTSGGELQGVSWLTGSSGAGETNTTSSSADVITPAARVTDSTTYKVTLSAAGTSDLVTPLKSYSDGLKLLINESPTDHGSDSRRVFVPDVGFVLITTPLALVGGASQEYRLQNIKDVVDAGTACGI
ncbi:MAG: hypothetical protein IPJ65_20515 [Archangiaceae bacterium]|nr:hypothetical protein [Archangiaceae bacterium]